MKRLCLLLTLALCGCPTDDRPPGDENMGLYQLRAEPVSIACGLLDIDPSGFDFAGTFSRFRDGGAVFLTLGGISRDAGFDGQVARSSHSAPRNFVQPDGGRCGCEMRVVETIVLALLSKSQSEKIGPGCPDNLLDGGVPGPDAGVKLPGSTPETGFDSVRACGVMFEDVGGIGACDPECSCRLEYRLAGDRR